MTLRFLILLSIILTSFGSTCFSQQDTVKTKIELGVGSPFLYQLIKSNFFYWKAINASTKFHRNKSIIRTGINFRYENNKAYKNNEYNYGKRDYLQCVINIGYERRLPKNKFQFLYGFDIVCSYFYSQWTKETPSSNATYDADLKHLGIGPVVGLYWNPYKSIAIQTETGFVLGVGAETGVYDHDMKKYRIYTRSHRVLSFSIIYSFNK